MNELFEVRSLLRGKNSPTPCFSRFCFSSRVRSHANFTNERKWARLLTERKDQRAKEDSFTRPCVSFSRLDERFAFYDRLDENLPTLSSHYKSMRRRNCCVWHETRRLFTFRVSRATSILPCSTLIGSCHVEIRKLIFVALSCGHIGWWKIP